MKKKVGTFSLLITVILCLFFVSKFSAITSSAKSSEPVGTLLPGKQFYDKIRSLSADKIVFCNKAPKKPKKSVPVGEQVTAYSVDQVDSNNPNYTIVYIVCSKKIIFNEDSSEMFGIYANLHAIDFGNYVDTSKVKDMSKMFSGCYSVTELDLSSFDTSNVESMYSMFSSCSDLQKVNLKGLNTSKVTNFRGMFGGCSSLTQIELTSFNTSNAKDISGMFSGCTSLKSVKFGKYFKTDKVESIQYMFANCEHLESVDVSGFNTQNVTKMSNMFYNCRRLKAIDVKNFNTSSVREMSNMFSYCFNLSELDLSSFDCTKSNKYFINYRDSKADIADFYWNVISTPRNLKVPMPALTEMALDDNKDGIPDEPTRYTSLPARPESHRYIAWKKIDLTGPTDDTPQNQEKSAEKTVTAEKPQGSTEFSEKDVSYYLMPDGTAKVYKIAAKGNVTINTVTTGGITYRVTEICSGVAKGNTKLKALTIGKNVEIIGKNAFNKCKNLKTIKITANGSLKIEKNAFKKIAKGARIKVKGVKGKAKKALIKEIKKNSSATVG